VKDHYDFKAAERGKFYRPLEQVRIPIYLDAEVSKDLGSLSGDDQRDLLTGPSMSPSQFGYRDRHTAQ
jgi:hypothetical protein